MRPDGRRTDELRPITITPDFNRYAEGSVLIAFGETQVICTASVEEKVPGFLEGQGQGLGHRRVRDAPARDAHPLGPRGRRARAGDPAPHRPLAARGDRSARRSARARSPSTATSSRPTAARARPPSPAAAWRWRWRCGGCRRPARSPGKDPIRQPVAAISAGIIDGEARVDLPYVEDSQAEVDCNFVMTGDGRFVEIQATAEKGAFSAEQYGALVALASEAMKTLFARQREAIERARPEVDGGAPSQGRRRHAEQGEAARDRPVARARPRGWSSSWRRSTSWRPTPSCARTA